MKLKMLMALVSDDKTEAIMEAAREAGATGATVITSVRGEGLKKEKTFFGLDLSAQRDVLIFLVAGNSAREILEVIGRAGNFDKEPGAGIAFQINIEDAVGMKSQTSTILQEVQKKL